MIEYFYNAIKAVSGQPISISANITDENGLSITENCKLMLHEDNKDLCAVDGVYLAEQDLWLFIVPAEMTKGLSGRYWYCIMKDGMNLCFKQPIYLT